MLQEAHRAGQHAALQRFGLKTADMGPTKPAPIPLSTRAKNFGGMMARGLVGHPIETLQQGMGAFNPGGHLSAENVWWPKIPGSPVMQTLGRAANVMSFLPVMSAARGHGDPNEGRLSNVLSAAGSAVGNAYGFPLGGVIGSMGLSRAGASLGRHVGHFLGSRPSYPPPDQGGY
jgi:hypothetical protein